jgi:hypothetical protein
MGVDMSGIGRFDDIHGDEDEIQEEQRYEKELYNEEKAEESN